MKWIVPEAKNRRRLQHLRQYSQVDLNRTLNIFLTNQTVTKVCPKLLLVTSVTRLFCVPGQTRMRTTSGACQGHGLVQGDPALPRCSAASMTKAVRLLTIFLFASSLTVSANSFSQHVSFSAKGLPLKQAYSGCDAMTFDTVLVANRGEIAVRVIRTLRAMGIRSVAVFSDADAGARHVAEADVAVEHRARGRTARATSTSTPWSPPRTRTGAQAVHPGYGFLSENAQFAAALQCRGHRVHRAAGRGDPDDGRQDRRQGGGVGVRRAGRARCLPPGLTDADLIAGAERGGLSGAGEAVGRRWRQGHAGGAPGLGVSRGAGQRTPRGGLGVRRRHAVPRAVRVEPQAHRGAGTGRRLRQRGVTSASASAACSGATRR